MKHYLVEYHGDNTGKYRPSLQIVDISGGPFGLMGGDGYGYINYFGHGCKNIIIFVGAIFFKMI